MKREAFSMDKFAEGDGQGVGERGCSLRFDDLAVAGFDKPSYYAFSYRAPPLASS